MKKLIYSLGILALVLAGCSREEFTPSQSNKQEATPSKGISFVISDDQAATRGDYERVGDAYTARWFGEKDYLYVFSKNVIGEDKNIGKVTAFPNWDNHAYNVNAASGTAYPVIYKATKTEKLGEFNAKTDDDLISLDLAGGKLGCAILPPARFNDKRSSSVLALNSPNFSVLVALYRTG